MVLNIDLVINKVITLSKNVVKTVINVVSSFSDSCKQGRVQVFLKKKEHTVKPLLHVMVTSA